MLQELVNWPEYVNIFVGLLALTALPVMAPLFLSLFVGRSTAELRLAALVSALGFFTATAIFAVFGEAVLHAFGISIGAFQMAGGLLLLLTALDLLRMDPKGPDTDQEDHSNSGPVLSQALVPFTMPMLAGPGVLSAVVLFGAEHDAEAHKVLVVVTLAIFSLAIAITLLGATFMQKVFTRNFTLVFLRVMGLIVASIAFEFMFHGLEAHFPQIQSGGH